MSDRWTAEQVAKIERTLADAAKAIPPDPAPGSTVRFLYGHVLALFDELKAERARCAKARRKG